MGSYAVAAQGPSSPASLEEDLLYDLQVGTWNMWDDSPVQVGGVAVYGVWYGNMGELAQTTADGVTISDFLPGRSIWATPAAWTIRRTAA